MNKIKIGFIGLGLMGLPMAKNILKKKFPLTIWNRSTNNFKKIKKLGAKICEDLIDLPDKCDVIIMMLVNDGVCKKVSDVLKKKLKKGQILVDMSSTKQSTAIRIEKKIRETKAHFLDAPVSGGTVGANSGKLAIMAGGEKKIFNKVKNLFRTMGTPIYVGKTGSGQVAKLANQAIVGITIGAVSEAIILTKAAGANPRAVKEAIKTGFAGSPILDNHGRRILENNFKPGGRCSTQLKDMKNIIETAKIYNVRLPLSEKIKKFYAQMVKNGKSNLDHSALYLLLKKLKRN
jgi:2-hydroxy-3-oxopropionate reductase